MVQTKEALQIAFDLRVEGDQPCKVRLELGVDYRKARGNLSRKIFQLGEATYEPGCHRISRGHSFQDRSTRVHHPGEHQHEAYPFATEHPNRLMQSCSASADRERGGKLGWCTGQ